MIISFIFIVSFMLLSATVITVLPVTKGWAGEKLVSWRLRSCFPKDSVFLDNLYFHNGKRSCQIDHLVVSKKGIFVVETKNYLGLVYGNASDKNIKRKVLKKHYSTLNPVQQNERHIDYLRTNFPSLAENAGALRSIIVFAFGTRLRLTSNPGNIGTLFQLKGMIKRFSTGMLSEEDRRRITNEIQCFNRHRKN